MNRTALSRRAFGKGSAAAGLAAVVAGSHARRASGATKTLRVRSEGDIQVLDPAFRLASAEDNVLFATLNTLVKFRTDVDGWQLGNELAEEIEQVDPLTVKFRIKKGVPWTNGFGTVTAEDVKYSYERIAGFTGLESTFLPDFKDLKEVEVVDELSGVIHLKQPFAALFWSTLPYPSGLVVCKKAVEALEGKRFGAENPATCGPYRVREWVPQQRLVLEVNPDWPLERPAFDEVIVTPIEDGKAAELAFEAGELDFTQIAVSSLPQFREALPPNTSLLERSPNTYEWLSINLENPALQDIRVRHAIQYAVDVSAVLEAAYFGAAKPSTGIIAPGLVGHRPGKLYDYDPDKAKALIEEAGAEGLHLTLATYNRADRITAAQVIQANLAAIGLDVEVVPHDTGTFWSHGMDSENANVKDNQLLLMDYIMAPDPSWATTWFICDQVGEWNWERFCNEEFDTLNNAALVEFDQAKRDAMYQRMQDLMEDSGGYVFLTHGVNAFIYSNAIVPAVSADGSHQHWRSFRQA